MATQTRTRHPGKHGDCGCDGSHTEGCGTIPELTRLRYFHGQPLGALDLRREQAYYLEKARLRNRLLHGWGIVCGLDVTVTEKQPCRPGTRPDVTEVIVMPGAALDCVGNEIVVRHPRPVFVADCSTTASWTAARSPRHRLPDAVLPRRARSTRCGRCSRTAASPRRAASTAASSRATGSARPPTAPTPVRTASPAAAPAATCAWSSRRSTTSARPSRCGPSSSTCPAAGGWRCTLHHDHGHQLGARRDLPEGRRQRAARRRLAVPPLAWRPRRHAAARRRRADRSRVRCRPVGSRLTTSRATSSGYRPPAWSRTVTYRRTTGETLQYGDRLVVTLRGDFVLDECCRALDGNHVGGGVPVTDAAYEPIEPPPDTGCPPRPSGNGAEGGDFVSWILVTPKRNEKS